MDRQDSIEIVTAKPIRKVQMKTDRVLGLVGFAMATTAAFFPWYVFFNQDSFGVTPMSWGESRDLTGMPGRPMVSASPAAIPDQTGAGTPEGAVDPIMTATVPNSGNDTTDSAKGKGDKPVPQSFPGRSKYHLLHVANGRALIEDSSGMYIVRVGSVLPDNSKLATMEKRDGKWVIVTSTGEIISN